jgi:hypothetical protein
MLYINNKFVELNKTTGEFSEVGKDYQEKISQLKLRFGRWVTLRSRKEAKVNATGLLEQVAPATIPLRIVIGGRNGTEEWLYTEAFPVMKDNVVIPETTQLIVLHGELTIDLDKQSDLAYFLIEKHSFCQGKKPKYYIVDEEKMARTVAEQRRLDTKLQEIIYGENSKLNVDLNFLRLVGQKWGIGNAYKLSKDALQNQLFDIVANADKKRKGRGIDEFVKEVKSSDNTEQIKVGAVVQDAIDKKVIVFDTINKRWELNWEDGTHKPLLSMSIEDLPRKEEVLKNHMFNDTSLYAQLVVAMGGEKGEVGLVIDKEEVIACNDRNQLMGWAKALAINPYQKKNELIKQEILDKLEKN